MTWHPGPCVTPAELHSEHGPPPPPLITNGSGRAWRCTLRYWRDFLFQFPVFSGYASERLCKPCAKSRWWDETSSGWQLVRRVLRGHFYQVLFRRETFMSKQTLICFHDWIQKTDLKGQHTFTVFYFVYIWRTLPPFLASNSVLGTLFFSENSFINVITGAGSGMCELSNQNRLAIQEGVA